MSNYINYNGKLIPADSPIIGASNRGLRFGDGLFETIKYKNNEFQLLEEHLERLWTGLQQLQFEIPALFTKEYIKAELSRFVNTKKHSCARVRLTILRGNGGLNDAENHTPNFIIQSYELGNDFGKINSNGLQLCFYKDALKPCDAFSNLKHNNFLPYVMGALYAKQQRCNDAIILNQYGRIADSTIANIFLFKDEIIYTPSLEEGCIAGTMRQFLSTNLSSLGYTLVEKKITQEELMNADEIFLSNSMTPMKWVAGIDKRRFDNRQTLVIYNKMAQTFPLIFC